MARTSGGAVLARALVQHGVGCVFTLCGNHLLSTYDAAIDCGLRLIDVRHEAAAAHMADAWARVTGRPGVCLVTGGPGHTNALTGIATAYAADSPVIWLSGASEAAHRGMGAMQELDQVALARPVTKWSAEVADIRQIPEHVARAFQVAQTGRPGPVHLSLPVDVMDATVPEDEVAFPEPVDWRAATRVGGNPALVRRALDLLVRAERPVVVAGAGAWWTGAGEPLRALAEATGLPVFTVDTARGLVSDDHPLCLGYADPLLNPAAALFGQADAVLLLGKRLDFRLRFGQVFSPEAKLVQVDADAGGLGQNRQPAVAIAGSVAAVVEQLLEGARGYAWPGEPRGTWVKELRRAREAAAAAREPAERSDQRPIHPLRIVREVRDLLGDDYCLAFDAGEFVQWARQALPAREPGRWLRLGPLATLGSAIPFAIAAKLARPTARVFALTGDGGAGFYGFELDTAVRHRVPFVAVVANDAAWGMERNLQVGIYGRDRVIASELLPTRYDRVAEALGACGEHVVGPEALRPALERALAANRPALVNVESASISGALTEASVRRKLGR